MAVGKQVSGLRHSDCGRRGERGLGATWETEEYVVEAKGKAETRFWRDLLAEARERGMAHDTREMFSWNTLSGIIRKAHNQLTAAPLTNTTLRVLWVLAAHDDGFFVLEAFEKRLFGSALLSCIGSTQLPPEVKTCYYYTNSDFARFPDLDAAVLTTGERGILCVNTSSPRVQTLRSCQLYKIFASLGALRDPEIEEREGRALLVDEIVAEDGQNAFLRHKYHVGTSVMVESQFAGFVSVDLNRLG